MSKTKKSNDSEVVPKVIKDSIEETVKLGTKGYEEVKKAAKKGYKQGQKSR